MTHFKPPPLQDADEEISTLIETLHSTGRRLEELTGGQVDGVTDHDGRMFVLQHAQEQLRRTDAIRQAVILNALPAQIALLDGLGQIVSVNQAWQTFADANHPQCAQYKINANYLEACDSAQGDDGATTQQIGVGIRALQNGEINHFSMEYLDHSPTRQRCFLLTASPLTNKPLNGVVIMRLDITDRKQAKQKLRESEIVNTELEERVRERSASLKSKEAHLRSLLETIPYAIISIGTNGIIQTLNQGAQKMFGISEQEAIGQKISNFMDSPHAENHDTYLRNYLETGQGTGIIGKTGRQVPAKRHNGEVFPAELSVGELITDDEHLFVGVLRDVTAQVEIENQLRQSQKMEAVGRLTGGIAHDFNNLLTVIMGYLQLIERNLKGDEKSLLRIGKVMAAAKNGADLTRRLLSFSRQQVLEIQTVDINEVVREMEQMLVHTMTENITISILLSSTPCMGRTDHNQLENALLNLCINARDAMPEGGNITLETGRRHIDDVYTSKFIELQPGEYIEIAVTDTGTGIPQDVHEQIFEPFFTTKHSGNGTGLGLSTIFGFMKQSGGHVNVYSEVGIGSTFKLLIPAADCVADPAVEPSGSKNEVAQKPADTQMTLLVVEDDDDVRELAVSVLRGAGFVVIEAVTGVEGLKSFHAHPEIDMVFSDVIMPGGMSGPEMVEKIFEVRPDIPVLFASGYAEQALKNHETLLEHAVFLAKPYFASELPMRIRRMMEKSDDQ